jgi:hypothetical protein
MDESSISTFINKRRCAVDTSRINPLSAELNPICHLLAFLGTHHILHVSRIRVKELARRFEYAFDLDNPKGHA